MQTNFIRLEGKLLLCASSVGAPVYDFDYDLHFKCEHPYRLREGELCVLRIGAITDYAALVADKAQLGLRIINSADEHHRASDIEGWYPLIADLTPMSRIFDDLPSVNEVVRDFGWPVFVKGARQTSKHNPKLAVAKNAIEYLALCEGYRNDPILNWQRPVIRQFIELDPVPGEVPGKMRPSREFRSFWWKGELVGCGHYWSQLPAYTALDLADGIELAREAAKRVEVPFLVVDIARRRDGGWIVVECNDAQEAGYCGLPPQLLWRRILEIL